MDLHSTQDLCGHICHRSGCTLAFSSKKQLKKHQRTVHQLQVTCKVYGQETRSTLDRQEDEAFRCPTEGCEEESKDPVRIQKHVKKCDPSKFQQARVMPVPPSDYVHLVPAGDQVIDIPDYPNLAYNKYANILLCTRCHIGVPTNEVETHMWKAHHEKVSEADVRRDFLAHGVTLPVGSGKYPPARAGRHDICEPVQGLLMYLGYYCQALHDGEVCAHTVRKEKSFTNHYGHVHKNASDHWKTKLERRYVQHLTVPKNRYFCVTYRPSSPVSVDVDSPHSDRLANSPSSSDLWAQLEQELSNLVVFGDAEVIDQSDPHASMVSNYLEVSGIKSHIESCTLALSCSREELFRTIDFPEETASWSRLVEDWLLDRMSALKLAHYGLRKEGLRESTDKEAPTVGLSPLQERQTGKRYSKAIAKLLVFTLNNSASPLASFWSKKQRSLLETLKEISRLKETTSPSTISTIYGLLDLAMFKFVCFSCSLAKRSRIQSALEQFVALSMIGEDGSFFSPLEMTHTIAAVQYGIRLGTMFHWVDLVESSTDLEDDDDPSNDLEIKMMREHFSWISQDSRASPFMTIRDWIRLASTVIMNEQLPDQTHWADSEMTKLVVGSATITIFGIQKSLRIVITSLRTSFQNLLKGCNLPDFLPSELRDDSRNIKLHYNYLVASENQQMCRLKILRDWCLHGNTMGVLSRNWEEVMSNDVVDLEKLWYSPACWNWLEMADEILEMIYYMYHVGCGQPARGTEETCMLIRNLDSAPRNVYWRCGRIMLQTWYHKGQNITHRSKPRQVYLSGELSMQLHNYLAYVRPVQMLVFNLWGLRVTRDSPGPG
ncbi:hypothetical protein PGT21_027194 [Puccinia graminis f. sp. tritici]|uniref:C2H2-type domain-containing protein n=1 Tax=Puccinia graminis f. sp. tritici TaxID=56615 RepID=A0A5B0N3Q7_PUCGR|nr:hypothetical protein PGT21_027194 [Puccinia graminis f. sp. tritici]